MIYNFFEDFHPTGFWNALFDSVALLIAGGRQIETVALFLIQFIPPW